LASERPLAFSSSFDSLEAFFMRRLSTLLVLAGLLLSLGCGNDKSTTPGKNVPDTPKEKPTTGADKGASKKATLPPP
jgi:hypothetical protein